jgi:hypothetical protein
MAWHPISALLILSMSFSLALAQEPPQEANSDPFEAFVSDRWNKSFGVCLMGQDESSAYSKAWQDYRIVLSVRYELLMWHWFKNQPPKQSALEVDSSFQFQKIEPAMVSGTTSAEKLASIEVAVASAMKAEMPGSSGEDFRKHFGLLKNELGAYLQLLNRDRLIVAPYSGQDGFSVLYQNLWKKHVSEKGPWTVGENQVTPGILKSVDAMARTLWSEGYKCKEAPQGAYQAIARIMIDRSKLCEPLNETSVEFCSADGRLKSATNIEKVIAKGNSFPSWQGGVFDTFSFGKKKTADGSNSSFKKLIKENPALHIALCPTAQMSPEQMTQLKQVYAMSLKAHLHPNEFEKQWIWPDRKPENLKSKTTVRESYLGSERKLKSKIKTVTEILGVGGATTTAYDLKKNSNINCRLTTFIEGP